MLKVMMCVPYDDDDAKLVQSIGFLNFCWDS